jgi:hypothetical protein
MFGRRDSSRAAVLRSASATMVVKETYRYIRLQGGTSFSTRPNLQQDKQQDLTLRKPRSTTRMKEISRILSNSFLGTRRKLELCEERTWCAMHFSPIVSTKGAFHHSGGQTTNPSNADQGRSTLFARLGGCIR